MSCVIDVELKEQWEDNSLNNCTNEVGAIKSSIKYYLKDENDVKKLRIIYGFVKWINQLT